MLSKFLGPVRDSHEAAAILFALGLDFVQLVIIIDLLDLLDFIIVDEIHLHAEGKDTASAGAVRVHTNGASAELHDLLDNG